MANKTGIPRFPACGGPIGQNGKGNKVARVWGEIFGAAGPPPKKLPLAPGNCVFFRFRPGPGISLSSEGRPRPKPPKPSEAYPIRDVPRDELEAGDVELGQERPDGLPAPEGGLEVEVFVEDLVREERQGLIQEVVGPLHLPTGVGGTG